MRPRRVRGLPRPLLRAADGLLGRYALDPSQPLDVQRARLARLTAREQPPPEVDAAPATLAGVSARRLTPRGASRDRAVLYLHGGGYCVGSAAVYAAFAGRLARAAGLEVWAVDYRLAPEHPYPAALDDARAAFKGLAAEVAPQQLAVVGDSAGAGLAVALAAALRDAAETPPAALGLISPWLDLAAERVDARRPWRRDPLLHPTWLAACARAYAGGRSLEHPRVSPLRGPLVGLPPTRVLAGADDLLVDDADRFALAARDAAVAVAYTRVPGLWHDYPLHAGRLAAADDALAELGDFLSRHLDGG